MQQAVCLHYAASGDRNSTQRDELEEVAKIEDKAFRCCVRGPPCTIELLSETSSLFFEPDFAAEQSVADKSHLVNTTCI